MFRRRTAIASPAIAVATTSKMPLAASIARMRWIGETIAFATARAGFQVPGGGAA